MTCGVKRAYVTEVSIYSVRLMDLKEQTKKIHMHTYININHYHVLGKSPIGCFFLYK